MEGAGNLGDNGPHVSDSLRSTPNCLFSSDVKIIPISATAGEWLYGEAALDK